MAEINNRRGTALAKFFLIHLPVALMLVTGLLAVFLVIHTWLPVIISGGLVILGLLITVVLHLQYVGIRLEEGKILVHYYPVRILANSYRRIEIGNNLYAGGEILTGMMGLRCDLVLREWASGSKATYPPVSLLLFSKSDRQKIKDLLNL